MQRGLAVDRLGADEALLRRHLRVRVGARDEEPLQQHRLPKYATKWSGVRPSSSRTAVAPGRARRSRRSGDQASSFRPVEHDVDRRAAAVVEQVDPGSPREQHLCDPDLAAVHDVQAGGDVERPRPAVRAGAVRVEAGGEKELERAGAFPRRPPP